MQTSMEEETFDPLTQTYEIVQTSHLTTDPSSLLFYNFDAPYMQMYFARYKTLDCKMLVQLPPVRVGYAIHPPTIISKRLAFEGDHPKYVTVAVSITDESQIANDFRSLIEAKFVREAMMQSRVITKSKCTVITSPVRRYNHDNKLLLRIPIDSCTKQLNMYVATCLDPKGAPNLFHHNVHQRVIPQSWATFVCSMHISVNPKDNHTGRLIFTAEQAYIHEKLKAINPKKHPVVLAPFTFQGQEVDHVTVIDNNEKLQPQPREKRKNACEEEDNDFYEINDLNS